METFICSCSPDTNVDTVNTHGRFSSISWLLSTDDSISRNILIREISNRHTNIFK